MAHWLDKVVDILKAETNDLRELAKIAGYDAKTFYRGTVMDGADVRGQDLTGMEFYQLDLSKIEYDKDTILPLPFENLLRAKLSPSELAGQELLDERDRLEKKLERLLDHQKEIAEELKLRREGRVATKDAQISLALASLDHTGAARLIEARVNLSAEDLAQRFDLLRAWQIEFYTSGRDKGSNFDLLVAIELARLNLSHAQTGDQRGMALNELGVALWTRGERESGTARLEEAVEAYRSALERTTRERVPLNWATTQHNLGTALRTLGERESAKARLEEAVAAYRSALEERTRERVPLDWAATQNNLGLALGTLGERESGTARLEEAVAAVRSALEVSTRERVPLEWAMTQNNLGLALWTLGRRESGKARLEEAVGACRSALEEFTRERVPLQWATTQNNLGNALFTLGERESGTAQLEEAVAAYRSALEECTPKAAPYWHEIAQKNLARCLALLDQRREP